VGYAPRGSLRLPVNPLPARPGSTAPCLPWKAG